MYRAGSRARTVCTVSPLGYCEVALPMGMPTSLNHTGLLECAAMFTLALSERMSETTVLDVVESCLLFRHEREGVNEAAGVADTAGAAACICVAGMSALYGTWCGHRLRC